jgi:uncharacterized C2H2 Zn-finger protein
LCLKCQTKLKSFQEFKIVCQESDLVLRNEKHIKIEEFNIKIEELNIKIEEDDQSHLDAEEVIVQSKLDIVEAVTPVKKKTNSNPKSRPSNKKKNNEGARPRIQCPKCTKIFHKQDRLTAHILRIHEKKRTPVICTICNKGLADIANLRRHMR